MPLIEELPITQSHRVTHGWAYVPDIGPAPIAAVQPGNRKRNRDGTLAATANATAKQQKAVQSRLDSLGKENYKDNVSVPIPPRSGADKKRDKKMTPNVRRILTYQRGFAHYLADEEANLAATGGASTVQTSQTSTARVDSRRKANTATTVTEAAVSTPTPTPRRGRPPASEKRKAQEKAKEKEKMQPPPKPVKQEDTDTEMTDAPASASTPSQSAPTPPSTKPQPLSSTKPSYDPSLDTNPLLRTTNLPKMPSARVMALLTSEPPLTYTAARARVTDTDTDESAGSEKPVRRFCAVCGYWGKVKCRKCGEWTCGIMECWKGHEGVCVAQGMF